MRISDWSSDVCSSDLIFVGFGRYLGDGGSDILPFAACRRGDADPREAVDGIAGSGCRWLRLVGRIDFQPARKQKIVGEEAETSRFFVALDDVNDAIIDRHAILFDRHSIAAEDRGWIVQRRYFGDRKSTRLNSSH